MSSMVGPRAWISRWEPPRATHPMDVVMVSIYIIPHGLILHNVTSTHHSHSRFNCCFQLQGFWGCLKSSHQQWVFRQTDHNFQETQRWCHFPCSFQRPSWQCGLWLCTFNLQMLLCPLALSPPFPRTLAVRPPILTHGGSEGPVQQQ